MATVALVRSGTLRQHAPPTLLLTTKSSLERGRTQTFKTMETTVIEKKAVITDMKQKVGDILMAISWRDFANTYFQRSSSWFYHKMDGIDGNGGIGGFSPAEAEQLRGALFDLSARIRRAAENL